MRIRATTIVTYIPRYGGNRARWEAGTDPNPLTVELRPSTFWEDQAHRRALTKARLDGDPAAERKVMEEYLAAHVGRFGGQGLELPDGRPCPDGRTLIAHADQVDGELLTELDLALLDQGLLSEGEKKSSGPPPGSPASPPASSGTAGIVAGAG